MADDVLSRLRQRRNGTLAEIANLETVLARQPADSPLSAPTRQAITLLKAQAVEIETFLSAHGGNDA